MELKLPISLIGPDGKKVGEISMGGAEGEHVASLWLTAGDILNVRNIQGGVKSSDKGDLNLDIGAGSTEDPGTIVMNFDVGKGTEIFDGKKNRIAAFRRDVASGKLAIRHYAPTYFHKNAYVLDGDSWRKL